MSADPIVFNDAEQEISDHIMAAYQGILGLGLTCNQDELYNAVHSMQLFLIKHMLQRLGAKGFSEWYNWSSTTCDEQFSDDVMENIAQARSKRPCDDQDCVHIDGVCHRGMGR